MTDTYEDLRPQEIHRSNRHWLDDWDGSPGDYVRRYYEVPAVKGGRILFDGKPATITGFDGAHLLARLDDEPEPVRLHPRWKVEYLPTT